MEKPEFRNKKNSDGNFYVHGVYRASNEDAAKFVFKDDISVRNDD